MILFALFFLVILAVFILGAIALGLGIGMIFAKRRNRQEDLDGGNE